MNSIEQKNDVKGLREVDDSIRLTILECYKDHRVDSSIFNERVINGGVSNRLLNSPTVIKNHIHIWGWFEDLLNRRNSPTSPIDLCEMEVYFRLMQIAPNPAEVEMLLKIDQIFVGIMNGEGK